MQKMNFTLQTLVIVLSTLTGCASMPTPTALPVEEFNCNKGGSFTLTDTGKNNKMITVAGMRINLLPDTSTGDESVYSSDMLRLFVREGIAQVEMDGTSYLDNCHRKR